MGTFLFWVLNKDVASNYAFYEFLRDYDQREPFNRLHRGAFLGDEKEITGVLDGQQRLSSLYLAMMGSYSAKKLYQRVDNDSAYEQTVLYVNLLSLPYCINDQNKIDLIEDKNFEFMFLIENDSKTKVNRKINFVDDAEGVTESDDYMYWYKVGDVLKWGDGDIETDQMFEMFLKDCESRGLQNHIDVFNLNKRFVKHFLQTIHQRINKEEVLNFFTVIKDDLEDVLKIFIRVNSGGTQLNKTDLLFSTIVANWNDGREEIEKLQKEINNIGNKFSFTNEFLMRCCLVLTDSPVLFKVDSFKSENVEKIRTEWPSIALSIKNMVLILAEFGLSESQLESQNSTLIIVYYLYKGGDVSKESKEGILKYLAHTVVNNLYSSSQDQLIVDLRKAFRVEKKLDTGAVIYEGKFKKFLFDDVLKIKLPSRKKLSVSKDNLDNLLEIEKGKKSFLLLTLLYPNLSYRNVSFHQDHIHPSANFSEDKLKEMGIDANEISKWIGIKNKLPNLQLMEGIENVEKNDNPISTWLSKKNSDQKKQFLVSNFIPLNISLEFKDFIHFFEARKKLLRLELSKVLAIDQENTQSIIYQENEDWDDNIE